MTRWGAAPTGSNRAFCLCGRGGCGPARRLASRQSLHDSGARGSGASRASDGLDVGSVSGSATVRNRFFGAKSKRISGSHFESHSVFVPSEADSLLGATGFPDYIEWEGDTNGLGPDLSRLPPRIDPWGTGGMVRDASGPHRVSAAPVTHRTRIRCRTSVPYSAA